MPFERAFKLSSLFLAAVAFTGLVLAHGVPVWLIALTGSVLIITLLETSGGLIPSCNLRRIGDSAKVSNLLLIGAFLLFLIDLTAISRDLLPAGVHFLVMLLGIKLLSLNQRRDFRHVYAISLMAVLASAALTTDVWYISIFVLYVFAAVWTLLLYHLTDHPAVDAEHTSSPISGTGTNPSVNISGRFFWLTNGVAIATFALTLSVFFLLPRIGAGLLQKSRAAGLKTTGFSERVDLGTIGSVKEDPQVVMRVELPDMPGGRERLYLRGVAYDRYGGRSWSTSMARRRNLGSFGDGTFIVRPGAGRDLQQTPRLIQQDILLEPLDTPVLFAAPFADYVSGDLPGLQADSMTGIYLPVPASSRVRYSVVSREPQVIPDERTAAAVDYPRSVMERYLQLPELSDKIAELSRQVARNAASPYERITAIQDHLLRTYRYSLDVETATSLHPLEDFLFARKTGYCEHYATAMVTMLRAVGVPSRLVTGFLATEWNEFGGYFTVRQRDAHAWVEVYFPQSGWITFDPTPAAGTTPSRSIWDAFFRISESLRLHWDRFFINYSAQDQLAVIHGMREGSDALKDHVHRWIAVVNTSVGNAFAALVQSLRPAITGLWSMSIAVAALSVIALIVTIQKKWWLARLPQRKERRRQLHITGLYRTMLRQMAGNGLAKSPSATPGEFARMVQARWAKAGAIVTMVTNVYCRARFSSTSLTTEEISEVERHVRALRQLSRPAA